MTDQVEIVQGGVVIVHGPLIAEQNYEQVVDSRITRLAFLDRFTDAEAVAIDLASIGATVQAAGLRRYLHKVNSAQHIDLARADLQAGVQALEAAGLLAAGRAQQILTAPITDIERYKGQ